VSEDERARLFVAVWPPDRVLDLLAALPRADRPGVRWTTRDQWHITLQFLGTVPISLASAAMTRVEAPAAEAVLRGRPGRLGRDAVVVPVLGLDRVAGAVRAATEAVGLPAEPRPFHGHLTLARLKGAAACGLTGEIRDQWSVTSVALVRSHLGGGPARYETIAETMLQRV